MRTRKVLSALVAWYALYQAVHLVVNGRALFLLLGQRRIGFPALPPPGGWSAQVVDFFVGMAALDTLNAALTLLFAWGFFRSRPWAAPLGWVVLTVSVYAALVFDYATWAAGAWQGAALGGYLFINVTFLPVVALYIVWWRRGLRETVTDERNL